MTKEFIHDYKGYGVHTSQCLVKMFTDDGDTFICFIDMGVGTSVTNASEQLATEMVNKFILRPEDCRFFETYRQYNYETFDEIEYSWWPDASVWEARSPKWKPVIEDGIKELFINE